MKEMRDKCLLFLAVTATVLFVVFLVLTGMTNFIVDSTFSPVYGTEGQGISPGNTNQVVLQGSVEPNERFWYRYDSQINDSRYLITKMDAAYNVGLYISQGLYPPMETSNSKNASFNYCPEQSVWFAVTSASSNLEAYKLTIQFVDEKFGCPQVEDTTRRILKLILYIIFGTIGLGYFIPAVLVWIVFLARQLAHKYERRYSTVQMEDEEEKQVILVRDP